MRPAARSLVRHGSQTESSKPNGDPCLAVVTLGVRHYGVDYITGPLRKRNPLAIPDSEHIEEQVPKLARSETGQSRNLYLDDPSGARILRKG